MLHANPKLAGYLKKKEGLSQSPVGKFYTTLYANVMMQQTDDQGTNVQGQ
jgi:hypothetical protein